MEVNLRDPKILMKLSKLGSFHQSKLSFLRSFLNEFRDWEYRRDLFNLNNVQDRRDLKCWCFSNDTILKGEAYTNNLSLIHNKH